ncbi:hypothetical protein [Kitasatospora sp. NPDC088783]|uniref:hypothetical protein n=1 Tax=Kitasatospora sp. NPDC088783 TaxID=3364077 RepID=UPI00381A82E7
MRQGLRHALGAAALLAALTACSPGSASPVPPVPAPSSATAATPSASAASLDEVFSRTRTALTTAMAGEAEAPDPQTLMLVQAWPGGAAYVWETPDQRQCFAEVHQVSVRVRGCADHQEVTSAACGDTPLTVRRIGTLADGARTLYALWFPTCTKGDVTLTTLDRTGATARATLPFGDIGDRTCTPAPYSG